MTVPFSLLGYISKNKVQRVLGLFFLALFMGLMAMCFRDPKTDPDIVRYIAAVKDYANVSFFRAFNHGSYENLYVIDIWFWIIAKTGNYQLIAGTSVFFTYLISLYVLQDYAHSKSFNLRQRVYTLFLLMGLMNFCFSVNALRSELAFAMILLAVYRELYQKRRSVWTYFLYVLPIFMHFAAILLVLIRFIAVSYTQAFLKRTLMYFNWDTGGWATVVKDSGYYLLNKVFSYSVLVMMALAFWNIKRSKKKLWDEKLENYFAIYFFVIIACFFMQTPSYQRFTFVFFPYGAALFGQYVRENASHKVTAWAFNTVVCCLAMVGYFLSFYMLNTMIPVEKFVIDVLTYSPLFS